jgi:hypothetical protein
MANQSYTKWNVRLEVPSLIHGKSTLQVAAKKIKQPRQTKCTEQHKNSHGIVRERGS